MKLARAIDVAHRGLEVDRRIELFIARAWEKEIGRQHANDRIRVATKHDLLADDGAIAAEEAIPRTIRQHDDAVDAAILALAKRATERGVHAEHVEEVRGDAPTDEEL